MMWQAILMIQTNIHAKSYLRVKLCAIKTTCQTSIRGNGVRLSIRAITSQLLSSSNSMVTLKFQIFFSAGTETISNYLSPKVVQWQSGILYQQMLKNSSLAFMVKKKPSSKCGIMKPLMRMKLGPMFGRSPTDSFANGLIIAGFLLQTLKLRMTA